ncbi:GtrA family protein [Qipengyuania sp. NPDC077563]|uniref:GtrA family protein n=1 Tax=Qipengyuania sp. NPDC077563 TaxID=3364497 RepID=UPI00384E52BC
MTAIIYRLQQIRLFRYGLASIAALAADMSIFSILIFLLTPPIAASAAAYSVGIVIHWLLSSRTVFTNKVAVDGAYRTRQKALFVASAMVGLALTATIVGAGDAVGVDPLAAKLVAIALSFSATWLLRSRIVFRSGL